MRLCVAWSLLDLKLKPGVGAKEIELMSRTTYIDAGLLYQNVPRMYIGIDYRCTCVSYSFSRALHWLETRRTSRPISLIDDSLDCVLASPPTYAIVRMSARLSRVYVLPF
jgi:hypothetical protein